MIEPGECLGIERLGVVAGVVEQAAIRPVGRVEVGQPHQVDTGARQSVGEEVGLLRREKRRGRKQCRRRRTALARPSSNASRPSLTVTKPRSPAGAGTRNETSSALLATIDARRRDGKPLAGLIGDVVRDPTSRPRGWARP